VVTGRMTKSARALSALLLLGAGGCELMSEPIRTTEGGMVVHAVLNPSVCAQQVFVEELLTGVRAPAVTQDGEDAIRLAGGIPVVSARVVIRRNGADSAVAVQRFLQSGGGTGIYEIESDRCALTGPNRLIVRGGDSYELFVTTPDGRRVTGRTRIPRPTATPAHVGPRLYNVDTDSFRIETRPADFASRYVLSVNNTRWGAITLRIETSSALVRGQVEYVDDFEQADVFWPGMLQRVVLAATDENYGDYVTTWSDPLTGRGQVHGLTGGYGLFGSVTPLGSVLLDVSADEDDQIEGRWDRTDPPDLGVPYPILRLYIDDGGSLSMNDEIPLIGSMQPDAFGERVPLDGWMTRSGSVRLRYRRWPAREVDLIGAVDGSTLVLDDVAGNRLVYRWRSSRTN
jgi:hypothetical protein